MRLVRLWFTDVLGNLKSFAISPAELENALEDGMTLRRLVDRRLQPRAGERRARRSPTPTRSRCCRGATRRRPRPGSSATSTTSTARRSRATRARCCAATWQAPASRGFTFYVAPDIEFFYFAPPAPRGSRRSRSTRAAFFDLTTNDVAGSLRKQTIRTLETMGIPVEYSFHEDAPEPARDRPAPHRRADDGRQHHDVPAGREGGGGQRRACTPRSCPSRSRACRARACTSTCRCSTATRTRSSTPTTPTTCRRSPSSSWPACCATPPRSPPSPTRPSTATSGWCPGSRRRSTSPGPATTAAA